MFLKESIDKRRFDLQLFAEGEVEPTSATEAQEPLEAQEGKRYTDAEVDAIVNRKYAKWKAEQEKAVAAAKEEAGKLAKMNADQKRQYEAEKSAQRIQDLEKEIEGYKRDAQRAELSKSAANILKEEHQIIATQDMLDFVTGEDEEATKANIAKLVGIILDDRKNQEERRATGTTPKSYRNQGEELDEVQKRIAKYRRT